MFLRSLLVCLIAALLWLITTLGANPALALTQIQLSDLTYEACPEAIGAGAVTSDGSGAAANCFLITGKANNPSGKPVYNADIFGRVYDANGNPVMQNRNRLGAIDYLPPGTSDFQLRISVPANQPTPLQLEQFKASGFSGQVRR
ncbi:hypothetical protein [Trichothermofontia sp.]